MTDESDVARQIGRPADLTTGDSLDRLGPTAIVSYISLFIFAATAAAVIVLVANNVQLSAAMAGILGTILGASANGASTTQQFWLGGNVGAKATTRALEKLATTPSSSVSAPLATVQNVTLPPATDPNAPVAPPDTDLGIPEPKP